MKTNITKLDELTSKKSSGWLDKANWRKQNEAWLDQSFKIALKILSVLQERKMTQKDLADKMGVTPQYINKIVKGTENLSLETISILGAALSIDFYSVLSQYQTSIDEFGTITLGDITMKYKSYGSTDIVKNKSDHLAEKKFSTPYNTPGIYKKPGVYNVGVNELCRQMLA